MAKKKKGYAWFYLFFLGAIFFIVLENYYDTLTPTTYLAVACAFLGGFSVAHTQGENKINGF
tara:strand:+ start:353 stop:538 length:186 start_codon:yes stop_codon:yes gene_type:complete